MEWLGIDVSHWDGEIDLRRWIDERGAKFVIVKAGGDEDERYRDSKFARNYKLAKSLGLHVGAYYYTTSTTVERARVDARHFCDLLEGCDLDMPCYMDVEDPAQLALSRRALTDVIKAFCEVVTQRGRKAGLYTSGSAWNHGMYPEELRSNAIWIACWKATWPTDCGEIGMWQQGGMRLSDGDIQWDDVPGYNDLDWCRVDYPALIKPKVEAVPKQAKSKARNDVGLRYRAHCQNAGWMPWVHDGQTAGSEGYSARLEAIELSLPSGVRLEALAHLQDWGNLFYEFDGKAVIGTTGQARRMEAIRLHCTENGTGKSLRYQGHVQDLGWTEVFGDGEWCGTRGESRRLEAVRIWFE